MLKNALKKMTKWSLIGLLSGCSFQSSQLNFILERLSPESSNDVQAVYWKLDGQGLSGRLIPVFDSDRIFFTDLARWMVVFQRDLITGIYNLETGSKLSIAVVDPKSIMISADAPEELGRPVNIVDALAGLAYTAPGRSPSKYGVSIECAADWQVTVHSKQLIELIDCMPKGLRVKRIRDLEGGLLTLTYEFEETTLIEITKTTEPVEISELL